MNAHLKTTKGTGMISVYLTEDTNKDIKRFQFENAYQGNAHRWNLNTFHRLMDKFYPSVLTHLIDKKDGEKKKIAIAS